MPLCFCDSHGCSSAGGKNVDTSTFKAHAADQTYCMYSKMWCCFNTDLTCLVDNLANTFYLNEFRQSMNHQGSTTREHHLIPSGTNDKIVFFIFDINVWQKQVGFHTHTHIYTYYVIFKEKGIYWASETKLRAQLNYGLSFAKYPSFIRSLCKQQLWSRSFEDRLRVFFQNHRRHSTWVGCPKRRSAYPRGTTQNWNAGGR